MLADKIFKIHEIHIFQLVYNYFILYLPSLTTTRTFYRTISTDLG